MLPQLDLALCHVIDQRPGMQGEGFAQEHTAREAEGAGEPGPATGSLSPSVNMEEAGREKSQDECQRWKEQEPWPNSPRFKSRLPHWLSYLE